MRFKNSGKNSSSVVFFLKEVTLQIEEMKDDFQAEDYNGSTTVYSIISRM
jgi:hypothetical protein